MVSQVRRATGHSFGPDPAVIPSGSPRVSYSLCKYPNPHHQRNPIRMSSTASSIKPAVKLRPTCHQSGEFMLDAIKPSSISSESNSSTAAA